MRTEAPTLTAEILLLSQNPDEVTLVREAIENSKLNVVGGCPAVFSFLRQQGEYSDCPRPDLILLDMDLSSQEDCEMLEDLKRDPVFKRIPVVVLASDDSYQQILQAYDLHANAYILKPKHDEEFLKVMKATLTFWLTLVRLPREHE